MTVCEKPSSHLIMYNNSFQLDAFIKKHVTKRANTLFSEDMQEYSEQLSNEISGSSVLVIGGAGTIGSNFIKSLLRFTPKKLVIVDVNENGLTELVRDLRSSIGFNIPNMFLTYPLNYSDNVFGKLLKCHGSFDIVANFAAHKHVRSEKDHFSIEAMVQNNALQSQRLLELLVQYPPKHFFCVSTDKAANPVNIMGASKKLMEEVILAYSKKYAITTARFANVAFSNGSLPFGFLERLAKRQPLSAPSDVKRYFVSPEESGQICLLACVLGKSGEIFFPKLKSKDMMTFSEIGDRLLNAHGFIPYQCSSEEDARRMTQNPSTSNEYPVYYFTSDTSGEKSFEEFYTEEETLDMSRFRQLGVVCNSKKKSIEEVNKICQKLRLVFEKENVTKAEIVSAFRNIIPNFQHRETGKSLDQKM